jgi:hypothetical protein
MTKTTHAVRLFNPTPAVLRVHVVLDDVEEAQEVEVPAFTEVVVRGYWMRRSGPLDLFERLALGVAVASVFARAVADAAGSYAEADYAVMGLALWAAAYFGWLTRRAWRATR